MGTVFSTQRRSALHPVHAVLLASSLPLFLGALLSDWAYWRNYEVQWSNFASWLNAGALIFVGAALLWGVIDLLRADNRNRRAGAIYVGLLVATFVLGLVNALVHAKDAWATMPMGLILSLLVFLLALATAWFGFSAYRRSAVDE